MSMIVLRGGRRVRSLLACRPFSLGRLSVAMLLTVIAFGSSPAEAAAQGQAIPWDQDADDYSLLSLGPLDVRVKASQVAKKRPLSSANQATVAYIFKNGLSEGKLREGDVIVGVNRKSFHNNFTKLIGSEIDNSEGKRGKLTLNIQRRGKAKVIKYQLDPIGTYSKTWPYQCEKSEAILQNACDWLAKHQNKQGKLEGGPDFVLTSVAGLAMLGCDKERYREPIQNAVNAIVGAVDKGTTDEGTFKVPWRLELWSLNYGAMFLSEYYLATEDPRVRQGLQRLNKYIGDRQFHRLSPTAREHMIAVRKRRNDRGNPVPEYWFSHGEVTTKSSGYIHLGVNAANACVAWSLLNEAGVEVDLQNLSATKDFIETNCVSGAMGYAARSGQRSIPGDAFGRTGLLGVALHLDNDRIDYSQRVAFALKKLCSEHFYFSHSSCAMGKAWGVLAVAASDREVFRLMMDEYQQEFDLLRLSDGSFVANAAPGNRHGDLDIKSGGPSARHKWTTAFNALIYTLAKQKLRVCGAEKQNAKR